MKLLIVEDERQLSDSIVSYLSQDDYRCEQAFTCGEALMRIGVYEYDCILLDLMLPGGSGLDIFAICATVCFALATPLFYHLTEHFYAEDMIDIIKAVKHGKGIPPIDFREDSTLFQRFRSGDRPHKGNGLGLAIVKAICDFHGWQVAYRFQENQHQFMVCFQPVNHPI